jgi:hypothetical protein
MSALVNEAALADLVRQIAREESARPPYVSQRTVLAVVGGIGPRDYLRLAREGAFPSRKERRLVIASTEDVIAALAPKRDRTGAGESRLLARVGARRVRS